MNLNSTISNIKNLPKELILAIQLPFRVYAFIRNLFKTGYVEITTVVENEAKDKSYFLQTLIQADGDIIHYIPEPKSIKKDKETKALLAKCKEEHQEKINDLIIVAGSNASIASKFIDTALIATNAYPIYEAFMSPDERTAIVSGSIAALSVAFRKYAKPFVVDFTLKGAFKVIRFFVVGK
ncbi:hypothetical protein R9C00_20295 [Flammeovirgaceae bacterium SG7u.111]|nr:hypothetical protein [Flammeovirgaceae bacterium SG7u.132]WPO34043.1 hypothetical protein R9C00_20295 [Flammeovirgaceae bacterium SG7u.111]